MSAGKVIALHGSKRAAGRSVDTRPLTDMERAARTECEWFRSCKALATVAVTGEYDGDVPVCDRHLDTVPTTRHLRALGIRRNAIRSQLDKVDREIGGACQSAAQQHGDAFPVLDMARVTGIARSTIIRWLDHGDEGTK